MLSRSVRLIVPLVAGIVVSQTRATPYLELRGTFASTSDYVDLYFSTSNAFTGFVAETHAYSGGTGVSGFSFSSGGVEGTLQLFNSVGTSIAYNDQIASGDFDARLYQSGVAGPGTAVSSMPIGSYRLRSGAYPTGLHSGSFGYEVTASFSSFAYTTPITSAGARISTFRFGDAGSVGSVGQTMNISQPFNHVAALPMDIRRNATLTISGTANINAGLFTLDSNRSSQPATVVLAGGNLTTQSTWLSEEGTSTSVFRQTGGTHTITGYEVFGLRYLQIASIFSGSADETADARYEMDGGTLNTPQMVLGSFTSPVLPTSTYTGTYRQTGGVANIQAIYARRGLLEIAGGTLNGNTIESDAPIIVSGGTLDVSSINTRAPVSLLAGVLSLPSIAAFTTTDSFTWTGGTLEVDAAFTPAGGHAVGSVIDLTPGKILKVNNTFVTNGVTRLIGGKLTVNTLGVGAGTLQLDTGTLEVVGSTLNISSSGPIGANVLVNRGLSIVNNGMIAIASSGFVSIAGGGRVSASTLSVASGGTLVLDGADALIDGNGTLSNGGLVGGTGIARAALTNNSTGQLWVDPGDTLRFIRNSASTNAGVIRLDAGHLAFAGTLTNNSTGDITGRGTLETGGLINSGDIALSGSYSDVYGDVTNNAGGRIILSGNANVSFWDDVTNNAGASVRVSPGAVASFYGTYGGGSITGGGTVNFEADVTPGFSPALITIGGDAHFSAPSDLVIELGGAARGSQYDAIDISGSMELRGALTLTELGGYVPNYLVAHRVLTSASRDGTFTSISGIQLSSNKWLAVKYVDNNVDVIAALPGDADIDGDVDFDDLLTLAQNYNLTGDRIWQTGDFDGNSAVTFDDLLALAQHYGMSLLGSTLQTDAQAQANFTADWQYARSIAPEPMSLSLVVLAITRRRRPTGRVANC